MSSYIDGMTGDAGQGAEDIMREAEQDQSSWKGLDWPGTPTLMRLLLLADWASREPLRWSAYRLRYFDNLEIRQIAMILNIGERTVHRYLKPVFLSKFITVPKKKKK